MLKFSKLYKKSSTGKLLEWEVWTTGDTVYERHGQVGGALQETPGTKCVGKQGRSNEEQATAEAKSKWEKKQKAGNYTPDQAKAMAGESSDLVEGGILPMLAHKFSEAGDKIKYPAFVQPKLDGHRCITVSDGTMWSRTRKLIISAPHIARAVEHLRLSENIALDGELYNHGMRDRFEELTSLIRKGYPAQGYEQIQYHVYDAVIETIPFRDRIAWVRETLVSMPGNRNPALVMVETREVANEDELMLAFEDFLAQGYEGAIVRNADGLYVNKRSYDLQKVKQFDDSEFTIVGVEEGKGKLAGHGIFVCKCATNRDGEFRAKMKGDTAELKKYYEHPEDYIGRRVTVKYQGISRYGVPRFPVALRIAEKL